MKELVLHSRSKYPVVWVRTQEPDRVVESTYPLTKAEEGQTPLLNKQLFTWDNRKEFFLVGKGKVDLKVPPAPKPEGGEANPFAGMMEQQRKK